MSEESKRCGLIATPLVVCIIPIVGVLLLMILVPIRAYRVSAERRIANELLISRGYPASVDQMQLDYESDTDESHTIDWMQVINLAWPNIRNDELGALPGLTPYAKQPERIETEQDEKRVAKALDYLHPVLAKVSELPSERQVYLPVILDFKGNQFLQVLSELRSLGRIISLEMKHATYLQDGARTMQAIEMHRKKMLIASDQRVVTSWQMHAHEYQVLYGDILSTLQYNYLNEDELSKIETLLRADSMANWNVEEVLINDFKLSQAILSDNAAFERHFDVVPWELIKTLLFFDDTDVKFLKLVATNPTISFEDRLRKQSEIEGLFQARLYSPFALVSRGNGYLDSNFDTENLRRVTLAAVGVKRYQLQFGEWPNELNELKKIGFDSDDYTPVLTNYSDSNTQRINWLVEYRKTESNVEIRYTSEFNVSTGTWDWTAIPIR